VAQVSRSEKVNYLRPSHTRETLLSMLREEIVSDRASDQLKTGVETRPSQSWGDSMPLSYPRESRNLIGQFVHAIRLIHN